jgi:hypothetical protein
MFTLWNQALEAGTRDTMHGRIPTSAGDPDNELVESYGRRIDTREFVGPDGHLWNVRVAKGPPTTMGVSSPPPKLLVFTHGPRGGNFEVEFPHGAGCLGEIELVVLQRMILENQGTQ